MKIKKLVDAHYDWSAFRQNVFRGDEVKSFKHKSPTAEELIRVVRKAGGTDHTVPMSSCGGKYAIPVYYGITEEQYAMLKERRLD